MGKMNRIKSFIMDNYRWMSPAINGRWYEQPADAQGYNAIPREINTFIVITTFNGMQSTSISGKELLGSDDRYLWKLLHARMTSMATQMQELIAEKMSEVMSGPLPTADGKQLIDDHDYYRELDMRSD